MSNFNLKILHLFPDMLNLYGDRGNIEVLKKRAIWRGIDADVISVNINDTDICFDDFDIVFLGGGSEDEEKAVLNKLSGFKDEIKAFVENEKTLIAVCGGFEMLGRYFYSSGEKLEGLCVLDTCTEAPLKNSRFIGNAVIKADFLDGYITGFENHGGKTEIGNYPSLGKVITGFGSNGKSETEGVVYKNLFATYLHGPLLPKNPKLCDFILEKTLKHKYPGFENLSKLDDELENAANNYIVGTYSQK